MTRTARIDLLVALALTALGQVEVLLEDGGDGGRLVTALAAAAVTLPLAWRRSLPLFPLVAVTVVLPLQVPFGGFLIEDPVVPLVALVLALYSAGRHVDGGARLGVAAVALAALVATRIVLEPAIGVEDAVLTAVALPLPLLVGRWVGGQALLQRELAAKVGRLARDRKRAARQAAEEERMRIATDLQAAVAGGLEDIVRQAPTLRERLAAGEVAEARALLVAMNTTARAALADVRRVLGILRRDGSAPRLAPHGGPPEHHRPPTPGEPPEHDRPQHDRPPTPGEPPEHDRPQHDRPPRPAARDDRPPPPAVPRRTDSWVRRAEPVVLAALVVAAVAELAAMGAGLAALTGVAVVAPLPLRRRAPVAAAAAVLAAVAVQSAIVDPDTFPIADVAAMVCATYTIGARSEHRQAVAGLLLLAAGAAAHAVVVHPDAVAQGVLGGVAVPWTLGRIVRGQRRLTGERRAEAARIEDTRAAEARAAVTDERMRVARELHDAVAHSISVIAIQSGGADGIADRDPARAAEIATLIETVARDALTELSRLTALDEHDGRAGDERVGNDGGDGAAGIAVADARPSLARVDVLAQRARDGGLPVELRIEGEPGTVPAGVDLAAFRIVQEALANSSKHAGDARAWVVVRYGDRAVEVEVADDGRGGAPNGRGHGLIGMRERVDLYGGTLDAGRRPRGGFAVRARLPLERA